MESGIYCIENTITGHKYIGQSTSLKMRMRRQVQQLRDNQHVNSYLQRHYNKYGAENFNIYIVEYCGLNNLDHRECYWIKESASMERKYGYNLESGGNPQKVLSEATKNKKRGKNNPMYKIPWSEERRKKQIEFTRGYNSDFTEEDIVIIKQRIMNGERLKSVAGDYNVSVSTISKITTGKNWGWVRSDLNSYITLNRNEKFIKLHKQGLSLREIGRRMCADGRTIKKAIAGVTENGP